MSTRYCRSCRRETRWTRGRALVNTPRMGIPDFPGSGSHDGQTFTMDGPPKMLQVAKCTECGRSTSGGDRG